MNTFKKLIVLLVPLLLLSAQANEFYRDDKKDLVIDEKRNLMWQDDVAASEVKKSYADAKEHCQNLEFSGFTDWYLPDVNELKSIVKAENYPRAIFKEFKNVYPSYYWSSSEYSSKYAWIVLFIYEDVVHYHKTDASYVRCVRKYSDTAYEGKR